MKLRQTLALVLLSVTLIVQPAMADRVKDLASVAGVRDNQLVGYGLVVGLNGTGDQTTQTPFTVQSIINMLTQFGVTIPDGVSLQLKNVAGVTVHASLPAFAKPGQKIDRSARGGNSVTLGNGNVGRIKGKGEPGELKTCPHGRCP